MKFSTTVALAFLTTHSVVVEGYDFSSIDHFKPFQIPFETLLDEESFVNTNGNSLMKALQDVGMISITRVPQMNELKQAVLSWDLHECTHESSSAQFHEYADGSMRRTLATHTIPGGSPRIEHKTDAIACRSFDEAATPFREAVDTVTSLFAERLSSLLLKSQNSNEPLLTTGTDFSFDTIANIVEYGEHLEHFHSYQRVDDGNIDKSVRTIDFHLDQGLFLVFVPGQMIHQDPSQQASLSTGFSISLKDGTQVVVDFDDDDDLVVLLGDGVNQYINPRLPVNEALRAVPHALTLPVNVRDEARVWYGRMVLPPASAIHPQHGKTFSELRQDLINASLGLESKNADGLFLGCASSSQVARQLEEVSCMADTLMCWHKCMSLADFNVSEDICASQDKEVACINPRGQLWDGTHGDFYPGCATNDTEIASPFPTLPNYPPDATVCTNTSFVEFANALPYENQINLIENKAVFLWNTSENVVQGRLVFNGLLGYLSVGLANVDGAKNGMHGADILMAIPGGDYSAFSGFDLSIDPSVHEFEISPDPDQSSFRFWGVEADGTTSQARNAAVLSELDLTDCFSSFTFEADSINGIPFNMSGVDQLLWAANGMDSFAGHHGMNRGRFVIDWPSGKAELYQAPAEVEAATPSSGTVRLELLSSFYSFVLVAFAMIFY